MRKATAGLWALGSLVASCARPSVPSRQPDLESEPAAAGVPLREPDVEYVPSPQHVVAEMLRLASVGPKDVVYDLGCGDGRIVVTAARVHGARGVCIDIDPQRIREARQNASAAGVEERIVFKNQDLFEARLDGATVVTLFLWPDVNLRLRPKLLRELEPGTRVVSYQHDMAEWKPERTRTVIVDEEEETLYLWLVNADARQRMAR
jgi:protein-L-isoaspartate O-methyltransferase